MIVTFLGNQMLLFLYRLFPFLRTARLCLTHFVLTKFNCTISFFHIKQLLSLCETIVFKSHE